MQRNLIVSLHFILLLINPCFYIKSNIKFRGWKETLIFVRSFNLFGCKLFFVHLMPEVSNVCHNEWDY